MLERLNITKYLTQFITYMDNYHDDDFHFDTPNISSAYLKLIHPFRYEYDQQLAGLIEIVACQDQEQNLNPYIETNNPYFQGRVKLKFISLVNVLQLVHGINKQVNM